MPEKEQHPLQPLLDAVRDANQYFIRVGTELTEALIREDTAVEISGHPDFVAARETLINANERLALALRPSIILDD